MFQKTSNPSSKLGIRQNAGVVVFAGFRQTAATRAFTYVLSGVLFAMLLMVGFGVNATAQTASPYSQVTAVRQVSIEDFGAVGDGATLNTVKIQEAIDQVAAQGGGTVVIPPGVFVSGALFLKPQVNLHLEKGAVLQCSTDMKHFPGQRTWIEGHYEENFTPALINANGCDGLRITGEGTLDGAGRVLWDRFWESIKADRSFKNLDMPRARLAIIENSGNVVIEGVTFKDSQYWNLHIFRCQYVLVRNARFVVPDDYKQAPSSDGIDVDSSQNVIIEGCYFSVTDDCVAMKGAKGPDALEHQNILPVERVRVSNCVFQRGHHAMSLGSEATVVRDVLVENSRINGAMTVLNFKLRPDTPQAYENIFFRNIVIENPDAPLFTVQPWKQYFDLQGKPPPKSMVRNISFSGIKGQARYVASIAPNPGQTTISDIMLRDIDLKVRNQAISIDDAVTNVSFENVIVNGERIQLSAALPLPPLEVTSVQPMRFEKRGNGYFVDFGKAAFGNLEIEFPSAPTTAAEVKVRLGEKLATDGTIDRQPPGSVNYREITLITEPGKRTYQLKIPSKERHVADKMAVHIPVEIDEVTIFRYAEIDDSPVVLAASSLRQLFVHAPFDDNAANFESSDETLNAVWDLCKYTMKATTAFGVYIDGERERIPYEADAYINMLSHYACDLDSRVARYTIEHLLKQPTWPTEWSLHMPMMAAADYLATGTPSFAANHYEALKEKLLMEQAREDGLLSAWGIVDWPLAERDNYDHGKISPEDGRMVGPKVNTVVNAFYYHALRQMALLATALEKDSEAAELEAKAKQVYDSFNRVFFDSTRGVYLDGEGSTHASLHANMVALAFGLTPEAHRKSVTDFVQSRGMACSVYGSQYLLEALFENGRDDYAVQLMAGRTERSWWHMIELGSTMTLEAWDAKFKNNLTWSHAWGAAPANIISRYVLGVRPVEPGYREILIAPQLGELKWVRGKVPTAIGPVMVNAENTESFRLEIELPRRARATVVLPRRGAGQVLMDGHPVSAKATERILTIEGVGPGRHLFHVR